MRKRIRDLAIEAFIAVAIVCIIVFSASRSPHDSRLAFRWAGLAAWTALAFAYPLVLFRAYWRRVFFWVSCAVLLTIHLVAYIVVFHRVPVDMASLLIFLITMAEIQVLVAVLRQVVRFCAGSDKPHTG